MSQTEALGFVKEGSGSSKQPRLNTQSSRRLEEVHASRSGCATGRQETQTLLLLFLTVSLCKQAAPPGLRRSGLTGDLCALPRGDGSLPSPCAEPTPLPLRRGAKQVQLDPVASGLRDIFH